MLDAFGTTETTKFWPIQIRIIQRFIMVAMNKPYNLKNTTTTVGNLHSYLSAKKTNIINGLIQVINMNYTHPIANYGSSWQLIYHWCKI